MRSDGETLPCMRSELQALMDEYRAYHRHPANKRCHYVGVPLIVVSLVGLLSEVSLGPVSLALLVAAAAVLYGLRLSVILTIPFAVVVVASLLAAPVIPMPLEWGGFIVGWVFQFVGHYVYEKRSPAFLMNLRQFLVGPMWLVHEMTARKKRGVVVVDRGA